MTDENAASAPAPADEPASNGLLSKAQLKDRNRFKFSEETLELPEISGSIKLKTLSVTERDNLPDLVDAAGNPDSSIEKLAAYLSACAVMSDGKLTVDEALAFLGDWPASALDKVLTKFAEMTGATQEERGQAAAAFPDA